MREKRRVESVCERERERKIRECEIKEKKGNRIVRNEKVKEGEEAKRYRIY